MLENIVFFFWCGVIGGLIGYALAKATTLQRFFKLMLGLYGMKLYILCLRVCLIFAKARNVHLKKYVSSDKRVNK